MIKAINRQIIEVVDMHSQYYDRALLVVKPQYEKIDNTTLNEAAKMTLKNIDAPSLIKKKSSILNRIVYWSIRLLPVAIVSGIIGASITIFL